MGSEHTPGPWTLTGWTAPDDYGWTLQIGTAAFPQRVTIDAYCAESEANARLIAAAPDLLAALEACAAALGEHSTRLPLLSHNDAVALVLARAAVARARGTTP